MSRKAVCQIESVTGDTAISRTPRTPDCPRTASPHSSTILSTFTRYVLSVSVYSSFITLSDAFCLSLHSNFLYESCRNASAASKQLTFPFFSGGCTTSVKAEGEHIARMCPRCNNGAHFIRQVFRPCTSLTSNSKLL